MTDESAKKHVELGPFAARVIAWMDDNKISGRSLAARCDLSPSYFTTLRTGKTGTPSIRVIEALSREMGEDLFPLAMMPNPGEGAEAAQEPKAPTHPYGVNVHFMLGKKNPAGAAPPPPNAAPAPDVPMEATEAQVYLPLDVPVLGVSMGGDGHDFQFNGETVDYVRRPLGIAKAKRAYATFVIGESMLPAFREGAVVFVNPDRPPSIGDDVVIELHPLREGEPGPGYIKRLKKRTSTKLIVEQFNPPDDLEFDLADVKAMHRVVPWNELLGI